MDQIVKDMRFEGIKVKPKLRGKEKEMSTSGVRE